jgi:pimeloyl-ACP methyl ester carboxylesterase
VLLIGLVAAGYRVACTDLRGHGGSDTIPIGVRQGTHRGFQAERAGRQMPLGHQPVQARDEQPRLDRLVRTRWPLPAATPAWNRPVS